MSKEAFLPTVSLAMSGTDEEIKGVMEKARRLAALTEVSLNRSFNKRIQKTERSQKARGKKP